MKPITGATTRRPDTALDEADGFQTRSVGFEDLGKPCPEHRLMAEVALAFGGIDGCGEISREDMREEQRGALSERREKSARDGRTAACRRRLAGQERLFGHTL